MSGFRTSPPSWSVSGLMCTFTVDQATGGHGSETTLPNFPRQRAGCSRCSPSRR